MMSDSNERPSVIPPTTSEEDEGKVKDDDVKANSNSSTEGVPTSTDDSNKKEDESGDGDDLVDKKDEDEEEEIVFEKMEGMVAKVSRNVARRPCTYLLGCLFISFGLSAIGIIVGKFEISANNNGWQSRGTTISDRETQSILVSINIEGLFTDDDRIWSNLLSTIQPGWETEDGEEEEDDENRRLTHRQLQQQQKKTKNRKNLQWDQQQLPMELPPRLLQELDDTLQNRGCDTSWYNYTNMTSESRLWPIWKTKSSSKSILDDHVIKDICHAEEKTQKFLEERDLCFGCDDGGCLPPYSIVMYIRLLFQDGWTLSCDELAEEWKKQNYIVQMTEEWSMCIQDIKESFDPISTEQIIPDSCPPFFSTSFVSEFFEEGSAQYTSSVFATRGDQVHDLYDLADKFDTAKSSSVVEGTYDTQWEDFVNLFVDRAVTADMSLAMGSAVVVAVAILIQSRSPFITLMGLTQIILSFPLSYLFYKLIFGLKFFPFLNFIGVFVVFALGAGDIFVAVDKWKNARFLAPNDRTEDIAAKALPDAAVAMFLTTITTAVAFFSTAICPVAPITMFAIFCGLLIMFDYIMNVLLVFPALCIYDHSLQRSKKEGLRINYCMALPCCGGMNPPTGTKNAADEESADNSSSTPLELEDQSSLMTRALSFFYWMVHVSRWPLLVASLGALGICIYFATTLDLPTSSAVRLMNKKEPFEQNYLWRQKLLSTALLNAGGSQAYVYWGLQPADTGDHENPDSFSQLVLDDSFDSSSPEAQIFLRDYCEDLLGQEFAAPLDVNYTCPLTRFEEWLQDQSVTVETNTTDFVLYSEFCNGAKELPIANPSDWHSCVIAWSKVYFQTSILSRSDKVAIVVVPFLSRIRYDDEYGVIDKEWKMIENWVNGKNSKAPRGVKKAFFTSFDFWWYDTNGQMLSTAYSSAGIALLCAAVVILASSKSFMMTLFCTLTIGYVLTSVTACLVSLGWTLGFLESVCFAILIGVSVDFCIHLAHAYVTASDGEKDRGERIKYALIHMGPSILSTALTTILSAVIMLFTVITFFQKFALILFLTIVQASIGSFFFFVVLADCFGPTNPTYFFDRMAAWCSSKKNQKN